MHHVAFETPTRRANPGVAGGSGTDQPDALHGSSKSPVPERFKSAREGEKSRVRNGMRGGDLVARWKDIVGVGEWSVWVGGRCGWSVGVGEWSVWVGGRCYATPTTMRATRAGRLNRDVHSVCARMPLSFIHSQGQGKVATVLSKAPHGRRCPSRRGGREEDKRTAVLRASRRCHHWQLGAD